MGKKSPSQPAPPDPSATAAAQGAANKEAAIATARLNQVNEVTPFGSSTYTPTGQSADGIAQYQRTTTLNPEEQKLLDKERAINNQLLGIGQGQLGRVEENFGTPLDFSGAPAAPQADDAARQRIEAAMFERLQPQFDKDEEAMRTRLANTGFSIGGEGYNSGMDELQRAKNDARLAVIEGGGAEQSRQFGLESAARERAIQEQLTQRNQPLNELSALLGTSGGINLPQFGQIPTQGIAPADYTGPAALAYQGRLGAANQQNQANMAQQQSMFNLAGTLGAGYLMSDRRMKTGIEPVGKLDNGLTVYAFRYKHGGPVQIGLMAQEVAQVVPDAVVEIEGVLHVDYRKACQAGVHGDREAVNAAA